jgi:hypothetical protein
MSIKDWLAGAARIVIPMFVDEDVAVEAQYQTDGSLAWVTVMSMDCVEPGERFDGVVRVRAFQWLGFGWFGWQLGEVRPWRDPA